VAKVTITIESTSGYETYTRGRTTDGTAGPLIAATGLAFATHGPEIRRYAAEFRALIASLAKLLGEDDPTACPGCGRPDSGNCSTHLSDCPNYHALKAAEAAGTA
jgi:hypothetical protein